MSTITDKELSPRSSFLASVAAANQYKTDVSSKTTVSENEVIEKLNALRVKIPDHELERLEVLRKCNILDTPAEESFDRYTALAARYFKVSHKSFIAACSN